MQLFAVLLTFCLINAIIEIYSHFVYDISTLNRFDGVTQGVIMGNKILKGAQIADFASETIAKWHDEEAVRPADYQIVNDNIRRIRELNVHRDNIREVIEELVRTNAEMWHEEDKVRSDTDEVVLKAIRNINPLNQHRNDLIEEIDEIMSELAESHDWEWEED